MLRQLAGQQQTLTEREFFPRLISGPFHSGLVVVFAFGATLALVAAIASLLRGSGSPATTAPAPVPAPHDAGSDDALAPATSPAQRG